MRETKTLDLAVQTPSKKALRALRLAAVTLGIGLVMSAGVARAQDDDEDESTFEEKVISGIMKGIGGTNMENQGIDYRERSPLVVPPKIDLPQPAATSAEINAANWPKDPDLKRRKAAAAARKNDNKDPIEASRLLSPSELAQKGAKTTNANSESNMPGDTGSNAILSPSQLGFTGGFSKLFGGGNKTETAEFKGEPSRGALTQPPVGYQTPSPNFAYGTGPKESLNAKVYDPAAGKYGD